MIFGVFLTKDYLGWRLQNLTSSARKVEEILWYYLDFQTCTAHPSQSEIATRSGLSVRSVCRGITELEAHNIIRKTHRKSNGRKQYFFNEYFLLNYIEKKLMIPEATLTEDELDNIIDNYFSNKGL